MGVLSIVFGLLTLSTRTITAEGTGAFLGNAELLLEPQKTGGFSLGLKRDDQKTIYGVIGRSFTSTFVLEEVEEGQLISLGPVNLTVNTLYDEDAHGIGIKLKWQTTGGLYRFDDCYDFLNDHWYAGPMQENQIYPIETTSLIYSPYVTIEKNNQNIVERYWLSSSGQYIYIYPDAPLFVDYHNLLNNHICFSAQIADPYLRDNLVLEYEVWWLPNVRAAHEHAVQRFLGKPSDTPDFRMVQHPIWSTWAQFSYDVDQKKVLDFAREIKSYNFSYSQMEIDDNWETCYGSLTVNETKFPDFGEMVQSLKEEGYRVTLWIHPFINKGCEPWYAEAIKNNYVVVNTEGSSATTWWNSDTLSAVHVDFTNPAAAEWWSARVRNLTQVYGIDSFKFDAGETSQSPQIPIQQGDLNLHPHHITEDYVRTCAKFGDMIEVRSAFNTQDLAIFTRMVDRDSIWGLNNGLATVVTTTLQMNLAGYPFVLPDMIGGNGYNLNHEQADIPTKELFIRWVQANTFLPVMQYSFAPWNFDVETTTISQKYTELHTAYAETLFEAMIDAVEHGSPVNGPLWWIAPNDEETFEIWDEYLVGETIIVAPVLKEGASSRDIYLPAGTWLEENGPERVHEGPVWLRDHPAPLDTLPYFVRAKQETGAANVPIVSSVLLVAVLFNVL